MQSTETVPLIHPTSFHYLVCILHVQYLSMYEARFILLNIKTILKHADCV